MTSEIYFKLDEKHKMRKYRFLFQYCLSEETQSALSMFSTGGVCVCVACECVLVRNDKKKEAINDEAQIP